MEKTTVQREENLSEAVQDYLKAIYEISLDDSPSSTNQIAERLNVAPASVTGMLKRLSSMDPPLVVYQRHRGVQLTDEGRRISLQIIRKHRLIELFLVNVLGYAWDEVHEEAERLEHAVSFRFGERLARLLGEPEFDPHGDPIPNSELHLPLQPTISLSEVEPGKRAAIRRVHTSDAALLRYLGEMGVQPGAKITVLEQVPFDRTIHIRIDGSEVERVLGPDISSLLQVALI
jgi:DtxR family transcriptional regulator, Mn-dependent transcriptional regulator